MTVDDNARARALLREGIDAFKAGNNEQAAKALNGAWAIRQTYDVAASLAQAELALGRFASAAEHLDYCVNHFSPMDSEEKLQQIKAAFAQVKTKVGTVKLSVDLDGAEIIVDERTVAVSPLSSALYLQPGQHQLEALKAGKKVSQTLSVQAGHEYPVTIRLGATGATKSNAPAPDYEPVIATISVGSAALISSVVLLALASGKDSKREELLGSLPGTNRCAPPNSNSATCYEISSLADDAKTFRAISIVGLGTAAAAGVATYFLWPRKPDRPQVGVRALVLPSSTGVNAFAGFDGTF